MPFNNSPGVADARDFKVPTPAQAVKLPDFGSILGSVGKLVKTVAEDNLERSSDSFKKDLATTSERLTSGSLFDEPKAPLAPDSSSAGKVDWQNDPIINGGIKNLSGSTAAFQQGRISSVDYNNRIMAEIKRLKAAHPQWSDKVDEQVYKITGVKPANFLMDQYKEQEKRQQTEADKRRDEENRVLMGGIKDGLVSKEEVDAISKSRGLSEASRIVLQRQADVARVKLSEEAMVRGEKDSYSQAMQSLEVRANNYVDSILNTATKGNIGSLLDLAKNSQSGNSTPMSAQQKAELVSQLNQAELGLSEMVEKELSRPHSDGLSYNTRIKDRQKLNDLREGAFVRFKALKEAVINEKYGVLTLDKHYNDAIKQGDQRYFNDNMPLGRAVKTLKEQGFPDMTIDSLLQQKSTGMKTSVEKAVTGFLNLNAVTVKDNPSSISEELQKKGEAATPAVKNSHLDSVIYTLTNSDQLPQESINQVVQYLYGEKNGKFLESIKGEDQKTRIYYKMLSPAVTQSVIKTGDPRIIKTYHDWAIQASKSRLNAYASQVSSDIKDKNSYGKYTFDEKTGLISRALADPQKSGEGSVSNYQSTLALDKINSVIRTMKPIWEAQGLSVGEQAKKLYVEGFGIDVQATKSPTFFESLKDAIFGEKPGSSQDLKVSPEIKGGAGQDQVKGANNGDTLNDSSVPFGRTSSEGGTQRGSGPREIDSILQRVSSEEGVDLSWMRSFAGIESGFNPTARTGSYFGLFQLSKSEFKKWGSGDIFNPIDNARAAARKLKAEAQQFTREHGRAPDAGDIYLIHQQGAAGYNAHMRNPNSPAWQSMYSTGEGQSKGPGWSRQAIWGNVPTKMKSQFGSVENVSSQDFVDMWKARVARGMGGSSNWTGPSVQPHGTITEASTMTPASDPVVQPKAVKDVISSFEDSSSETPESLDIKAQIVDTFERSEKGDPDAIAKMKEYESLIKEVKASQGANEDPFDGNWTFENLKLLSGLLSEDGQTHFQFIKKGGEEKSFLGKIFGEKTNPVEYLQDPSQIKWPTPEEAKNWEANDMFRYQNPEWAQGDKGSIVGRRLGKGYGVVEPEKQRTLSNPKGIVVDLKDYPDIKQRVLETSVAVSRSPIASVGWDPTKFTQDIITKDGVSVAGWYMGKSDTGFANQVSKETLMHESIHRGFKILKETYPEDFKKIMDGLKDYPNITEEMIVRYLMITEGGDLEKNTPYEKKARDSAEYFIKHSPSGTKEDIILGLNKLAQRYHKENKPKVSR